MNFIHLFSQIVPVDSLHVVITIAAIMQSVISSGDKPAAI